MQDADWPENVKMSIYLSIYLYLYKKDDYRQRNVRQFLQSA